MLSKQLFSKKRDNKLEGRIKSAAFLFSPHPQPYTNLDLTLNPFS
jgi:hypothetical protein